MLPRTYFLAFLVLLALLPHVLYPVFLMQLLCMALFACAFNLLLGYTGLLSFGHAAFLGGSAFIAGQAAKVWGLPIELSILAGTLTGTLLGVGFGLIAIRKQGIYFAMITLALAQMVFFYALKAPFTGGEDGLQSIPRSNLFGIIDLTHEVTMYYFILALFLAGFLIIFRIIHSPFGQILKSIRENEDRAISLGYRVDRYKLAAFIISAALSGLAGSMKAMVSQVVSLSDVHWSMSGTVVLMTLIGGTGTLFGPIVGAAIIVSMEHYLGEYLGSWVTIIMGVIFVICVLTFRQGVVGELEQRLIKRKLPFQSQDSTS
ncbi:MAG TPA: branched-chain amino acid ABC transporter permease [Gammaproteobacteria bacterium]|nr:branched-chain amino acid ABC transporter permease [Gammaproteobacteria bacterium]